MDLRAITDRLKSRGTAGSIFTFERGRPVRRNFADMAHDVEAACARLAACGVGPGMRVGFRAPNSYDWMAHDLALLRMGAISVAFTDDFAGRTAGELCEAYDLTLLLSGGKAEAGATDDASVFRFGADNKEVRIRSSAGQRDDPDLEQPTLIFSSGSAGGLKGLVLSRSGIEACTDAITRAVGPLPSDRLLLFLPMSNFQQRMMYYAAFWYGFDLIVVEPVHLFRALGEFAPTLLIAPPAFYEAFETRFDGLPDGKRFLALALGRMIDALPVPTLCKALARALFRQAYDALGGDMRLMITGMAPIKRSTLDLFALMQLPLLETYGLIESGSVALNPPGANRRGAVGKLLAGVRVEFAPDGEILVARDHPIALRYFECAEGENERTFVDGRIATGDIGRFDDDGYLYLTGRKKEMIVTSGGKKVHPEIVEADIHASGDVERAVVLSEQGGASLAAIIVAKRPGDAAIEERVRTFIASLNRERWRNVSVESIVFTDIAFSRENGFLRPNLKLDRRRIAEHFANAIARQD